jgi:hypothetical protein
MHILFACVNLSDPHVQPLDYNRYPFHNVEFTKEPLIRKDATEAHVRRFVMQQYWYIQLKTDCANN